MSLENLIMQSLKEAMRAKDEAALRGLRAIKSAIIIEKTSGNGTSLSPETEIKILQKLIKQRKESLDIFIKQNREDLAQSERDEITVIEKYLPPQLSAEEIRARIKVIISEIGAISIKDMGKVMVAANKSLAGQADSAIIGAIVKSLLA